MTDGKLREVVQMSITRLDDPVDAPDLDVVLSFLPRFRDLDPDQAAVRWPEIRVEGGQIVIDRGENHPIVSEFIKTLYGCGFVRDYGWSAWQRQALRFYKHPDLLKTSRLKTCVKLLTLHARKEHFVDGHFASMVQAGHVTAILSRLGEIWSVRIRI